MSVILITSVSGDIGYSAVKSLNEAGYKIVGCDINPYSPVLDMLYKFYQAPPAVDSRYYIDFIKKIIKNDNIKFFLPISEPEIEVVSLHRDELKDTGVKILINKENIVDIFLDKLKTVLYLESIGVKVPKTTLLKEYNEDFNFPLIVKARKSHGSKKLWKAESHDVLEYLRMKDDGSFIVQEYLGFEEDEFTTGVFSDGRKFSSISFKRRLGADGTTIEAILDGNKFLDDLSVHVAKAIGLVGYINIQSRRVEDIFVPFEVNPRISGTLLFRKKFGFDDVIWWIDILSGKEYRYKPSYKSGRAIRFYSECYFEMERANR